MKVVAVLCLLAATALQVYAYPSGAPSIACPAIQPMGPHNGTNPANSANMSDVPYQLNLSQFQCPSNVAGYCYVPEVTYRITLSGENNEQFRGLLVQGRQSVGMAPVGTFTGFTSNTKPSNCTPHGSAVTHSNPNDKTSENLYWIAPASGTGPIEFWWAVVVRYQVGTNNSWYAPLQTLTIRETDGCPALTITNGNVTSEPPETPPFVGATATYFCNNGFTLDGNIMRTCESLNNGTWTGTAPQCIPVRYGDLRLARGSVSSSSYESGRLEIYINGEWGTVCGDSFGGTDALVACQQLGYWSASSNPVTASSISSFGSGSGRIWLDDVGCTGHELCLISCLSMGIGSHNCNHSEDVAIYCVGTGPPTVNCSFISTNPCGNSNRGCQSGCLLSAETSDGYICACPDGLVPDSNGRDCLTPTNGQVRLVNIDGNNTTYPRRSGVLEVYLDGQWRTVCYPPTGLSIPAAELACQQLGYTWIYGWIPYSDESFGSGSGVIQLGTETCGLFVGESCFLSCFNGGTFVPNCGGFSRVGISCGGTRFLSTNCRTPTVKNGDLRLTKGSISSSTYSSGRLEIYINGEWGTVCNDSFGLTDANVACQQLGYSGASRTITASSNSSFGQGFGQIWLNDVGCSGSESCLLSCSNNGIGVNICDHSQDVAIFCDFTNRSSSTNCSYINTPTTRNGDLRLTRGSISRSTYSSGRLEIYINGEWGTVCDDSFGLTDANVACQQLGYSGASSSPVTAHSNSLFGSGSGQIWLDEADCTGNESCLLSCSNDGIGVSDCGHSEDVAIFCSGSHSPSTNCTGFITQRNGDLRLSRGSISSTNFSSGRLEIYIDGEWRTVCYNFFSSQEGAVACRQLGYSERVTINEDMFQSDSNQLWLEDVDCSGNESCLLFCSRREISDGDCIGSRDVAITCSGVRGFSTIDCSVSHTPSPASSIWAVSFVVVLLVPLIVAVSGFVCFKVRRRNFKQQRRNFNIIPEPSKESPKEHGMVKRVEAYSHHQSSVLLRGILPHGMIIPSSVLKLHNSIGQGEFGVVYKASLQWNLDAATEVVAVKTLKGLFTPNDVDNLVQEVLKMHTLSHLNVMSLTGACLDSSGGPAVVMPYMGNGSVLQYLKKERGKLVLPDDADCSVISDVRTRLLGMCLQISKGMEYLTNEKIVHRDLAARNCMMDVNGVIKVADFGLSEDIYTSTYYRQRKTATTVKLPMRWMPPESITDGIFTEKSDIWSFGVTCWEVFTGGQIPYGGISPAALLQFLHNGERLNKPINPACSDEIYAIILKCWKEEPKERPDFSTLVVTFSLTLEAMVGYMDFSLPIKDEHPYAAEVGVDTRAGGSCVQSSSEKGGCGKTAV